MPPRFVSPGALARNEIERFLMARQQEEFEAQRIAIAQAEQASREKDRAAEIEFRRQQEDRLRKERQDALDSLQGERDFRRASTIADTAMPGVLDPGTATLLREQGFGSLVREGQPTQGADLGVDDAGVNQYAVIPGVLETPGGFRWQQARAQEQARSEAAAAAQAAAAERAAADRASREGIAADNRDLRLQIAGIGAQNAGATRALQDELTTLRIEGERAKQDATKREVADTDRARADARSTIATLATDLANDPNLSDITGALEGRGWVFPTTGNAEAMRKYDELLNKLVLEKRGDLKGTGAISNFEVQGLEKSLGLDRRAGPANLKKKILEIAKQYGGSTGGTQTGGVRITSITPVP